MQKHTNKLKLGRVFVIFGVFALLLSVSVVFATGKSQTSPAVVPAKASQTKPKAVVYKTPTCGCCTKWENHLEANGYQVESKKVNDLTLIKKENSVARHLQSCHTALIDGYVIEGHVPAEAIDKLLAEKPKIKGLAVPGMPMGSPGMEGSRKDKYDVIAFDGKGKESVFLSY